MDRGDGAGREPGVRRPRGGGHLRGGLLRGARRRGREPGVDRQRRRRLRLLRRRGLRQRAVRRLQLAAEPRRAVLHVGRVDVHRTGRHADRAARQLALRPDLLLQRVEGRRLRRPGQHRRRPVGETCTPQDGTFVPCTFGAATGVTPASRVAYELNTDKLFYSTACVQGSCPTSNDGGTRFAEFRVYAPPSRCATARRRA